MSRKTTGRTLTCSTRYEVPPALLHIVKRALATGCQELRAAGSFSSAAFNICAASAGWGSGGGTLLVGASCQVLVGALVVCCWRLDDDDQMLFALPVCVAQC